MEKQKQLKQEQENLEMAVRKLIEWQKGAWKVDFVDSGRLSAHAQLSLKKDESLTLSFVYTSDVLDQDERLETNIAALGSFDVVSSNVISSYYQAVGKLLQDVAHLNELKSLLANSVARVQELFPLRQSLNN